MDEKIRNINVRVIANKEPDFYQVLGKWLCRREIVNELGSPMWDDDNKVWFIYCNPTLQGCIGLELGFRGGYICNLYVDKDCRKRGIGRILLRYALSYATGLSITTINAVATPASLKLFLSEGFKATKTSKNFTWVERKLHGLIF